MSYVAFRFVKKSMTMNDLERQNAYTVTDNQKAIHLGATFGSC